MDGTRLEEHPSAHAFVEAEGRLFARYGLRPRTRWLDLGEPAMRARALVFGDGPPVVMVHGGGGQAMLWSSLIAQIGGHQVIAIDRPGCGLSDGFDYRRADLRSHAVSFLASCLDALGLESAPFVGNSMGGAWTLWLAHDRPQRVERMVQIGCPAFALGSSGPLGFRLVSVPGLGNLMNAMERPSDAQARRMFARIGQREGPDELFEAYAAAERLPTFTPAWLGLLRTSFTLRGLRPGRNIGREELERVKQPSLVIWGEHDPFGPVATGRGMVAALPDARLEVVRGGHLPWLDAPERCAELIGGFLS